MKRTAFSFLAIITLPVALTAGSVNLSGDTTGAPTFTRPTESGARSFFSVPYNLYQFNVTTSGQFTFTLNAVDPASYDTFLHLFINAFNPADQSNPAANFFAANDDANGGTTNSGLTNLTLTAGTTYFFVVDGFSGTDAGPYNASISGPGVINIVPEPSTIALFSLSFVGAAILAHRQFGQAKLTKLPRRFLS